MPFRIRIFLSVLLAAGLCVPVAIAQSFHFAADLSAPPQTLNVHVVSASASTGETTLNGGDTQPVSTAFTWNWGDGSVTVGYFPQQHTYADTSRNWIVEVTAHYAAGGTSRARAVVFFVAPAISAISVPSGVGVSIPDHDVALGVHHYAAPAGLGHFDNSAFAVVPRASIEYVLSVAALLQMDYANDDVCLSGGTFNQVVLRDPTAAGMYSLWFTDPISFAAGDQAFGAHQAEYASFFHEMGHNVSLNSPAGYYYGGKIDGNANAIFSETMAQIFQHATAYDLINGAASYGLDASLTEAITISARAAIQFIRSGRAAYMAGGKHFVCWNDPVTPEDETAPTFSTLAHAFCLFAEQDGKGYRPPLKRMMELLQVFDDTLRARYDQQHDTPAAAAFRSTLIIAAMSHGFGRDLRGYFRELNFPVDDEAFDMLMAMVRVQKDADRDGLTDATEAILGTSPDNRDSDADGVADGDEVRYGTDPLDPESAPALGAATSAALCVLAGAITLAALLAARWCFK